MEQKTVQISISLPEDLKKRLDQHVKDRGESLQEWLSRLITESIRDVKGGFEG